jgi:hypothetical protein
MADLNERITGWLLDRWPWGVPALSAALAVAGGALFLLVGSDDLPLNVVALFVILTLVIFQVVGRLRRAKAPGQTTDELVHVMTYVDRQHGTLPVDLRDTAIRYARTQRSQVGPLRLAVPAGLVGLLVAVVGGPLMGIAFGLITYALTLLAAGPRRRRYDDVLAALGA